MTNNIAAATAQIAINKNNINMLHQAIHSFKIWREKAHKDGDERYVKLLNAAIKKDTNKIARYVVVQKAAKKHLASLIIRGRWQDSFNLKHGKDFEDIVRLLTATNIKVDWMDSCGKGSV